uniref:CFAP20 domain containing n=1 Tax=Lates calcarifer TaxID=8187 RepID=A0A4W6D7G3_LATCA
MFRNSYQRGAVVEIFTGQGKDPVAKWKLCGGPSAIHKEYNKEVKGFVYCLEGSSQTVKMQLPENGKMSLGLLQRFLVLQVNIPQCRDFSIELMITDSEHLKRRLHLSTVHKELTATLLHAKIPLVGLKRNIWSTLCIDLVSFTAELFKGLLTLDGITLFATCKVRRIFTMKTEPTGMSDDDMFLGGAGLMDLLPRSCQFPPDVNHVTQMLNMENLQRVDMKTGLVSSDCVPDQSGTARSTSYRQTRSHGVLHTASGSRASGLPFQSGRKNSAASDAMDRGLLFISNTGSPFSNMNQKVPAESQSIANLRENLSHEGPSLTLPEGTPGRLQPHPPTDKQGSKKPQVLSAGRERLASSAHSDAVPGRHRRNKTRERRTPPSGEQEQQPLTQTEKTEHLAADEGSFSPARESSRAAPTPAESRSSSIRPGLSSDLQVWSSWESNEGSEPQLTLQEEVFIFSSQPHSPKRGQGQGDQEKMEMGDDRVQSRSGRRCEAQPEDDFIGSESDEDKGYTSFQQQRTSVESNPATPQTPDPALNEQLKVHPESHNRDQTSPKDLSPATTDIQTQFPSSGRAELAGMAPTRCLSPSAPPSRQERKCGSRGSEVVNQVLGGKSSVTLSRRLLQEVTLDDFPQHKPANQGHHYQNEMNPLLHSNPREWMDVLSPPIMPPRQRRRSGNTWNNRENLVGGRDESVNEEENEDEYLNLLYDPCMNCYFDPKTGKYYELA